MKGLKLDVRSVGVGLVAGSLAGVLGGYVLARARARREYETRLNKAVSEVKTHYARPLLPRIFEGDEDLKDIKLVGSRPGARWTDVIKSTVEAQPVHDPLEGLDIGSDDEVADDETDGDVPEGAGPEGGDGLSSVGGVPGREEYVEPPGPFEISREQFGELADEGFQTISVTYYAADRVLADDKDQALRDGEASRMVGALSPVAFDGEASGDPHIRYVRNRRLEVDFEIVLDKRSYAEVVLDYGRPNKNREAGSRTKTAS